ncbi:hypothetical protein TKK_0019319 [Trichogramma kaykai]
MIHCEALARVQSKRSRESSPPESMKVLVVVVVVVLLLPSFQTVVAEGTHSKIYQGEAAAKGEFPYQVSITVGGRHICGGSLVSAKHVLTAAHCVEEIVLSRRNFTRGIAVRTGSVMLGKGRNYLIRRISYHNGFRDSYRLFLPNDIAVVQLQKPVELSDYVKPIHLPEYRAELPEGSKVIVTGFGTTISNDLSPVLKKLVTETFSNTKCGNYFLRLTGRRVMTSQICAEKKRGDGTCTGDSGGALVDLDKTTIYGIVSGGGYSCDGADPTVYTKVSYYVPYIQREMTYFTREPTAIGPNPAVVFY